MSNDDAGHADKNPHADETPLENLHNVRRHYSEKKQEAMNDEDELAAAYHSGQISGLTHAIEVLENRE